MSFDADADAPGRARVALALADGRASDDVLERATLLISEVVTNAVRHAGGSEVRIEIWTTDGSLCVVVSDDGAGFTPIVRPGAGIAGNGGLGLPLLDTLSDAWGSGSGDDAWVWFEVSPRIVVDAVAVD